jgi:hypothetical protein
LIPGVPGRVLTVLARTEVELTVRAVAGLAGVSATQTTVVLHRLFHLGPVERRGVESAVLVRLMRHIEVARAVLTPADLQRGVTPRLAMEAREIRPAPARLVVFGSFAHGDAHEKSDIDVLAVPPPEHRVMTEGGRQFSASGPIGRPGSLAIRSICSTSPWRSCRSWSVATGIRGGRSWRRGSYWSATCTPGSGLRAAVFRKGEHAQAPAHLEKVGGEQGRKAAPHLRRLFPLKNRAEYDPDPIAAPEAKAASPPREAWSEPPCTR